MKPKGGHVIAVSDLVAGKQRALAYRRDRTAEASTSAAGAGGGVAQIPLITLPTVDLTPLDACARRMVAGLQV